MTRNVMKEILKNKYSQNPIENYLNYWINWNEIELTEAHDERRRKYEIDVKWLAGEVDDLNADTILSFGGPLMMAANVLKNSNDYPGKFYKDNRYGDPSKFLKQILDDIDGIFPSEDKLVKEIYKFATLAGERENVMKLPDRKMQSRGYKWSDQIPKFLYECFEGGEFAHFFDGDTALVKWIDAEHLECFFKDNFISKENIKPLISRMSPDEFRWLTDYDDLLELFTSYNKLLETRKQFFN